MSIQISLVSAECEAAIEKETDLKEMLRKAFKAARGHWMVLDEDPQFKGALNAVLKKLNGSPEKENLETEIKMLGQFNAFLNAASSGLTVSPPELPEGFNPIGLMKLWGESR